MKPSLASLDAAGDAPDMGDGATEGDEEKDPATKAADLILEAITDNDPKALADALTSFCTMHASSAGPSGDHKPALVIALHGAHKE
jgi:hypothetical protein